MPQEWKAENYAQHAAFVPQLGESLIDLLTVDPPARVLDLGCGDGVLTKQLVERGYSVLGVDASESMLDVARAAGLAVERHDGELLPFESAFDAVFSNAALHWMLRPDAVLAGVHRALRPGGELVAEFGGAGNLARLLAALRSALGSRGIDLDPKLPWYFPSPGEYATRLERAGFRVEALFHFDRPTPLQGDVADWLETFAASLLALVSDQERSTLLAEVRARLAAEVRRDDRVVLDYVRLRLRARRRHDRAR